MSIHTRPVTVENMSGRSVKAESIGRAKAGQVSCVMGDVSLQEQELSGQLGDFFLLHNV